LLTADGEIENVTPGEEAAGVSKPASIQILEARPNRNTGILIRFLLHVARCFLTTGD
jgi:hypothetical protein